MPPTLPSLCFATLLLLSLLTVASAREYDVGSVTFSASSDTAAAKAAYDAMLPGTPCHTSAVADLPTRWALPQFPAVYYNKTVLSRKWGPDLNAYPATGAAQVPAGCNPTAWAWVRMNRVIQDTLALDINYCHHHAPAYDTPADVRVLCDPTEPGADTAGCVCNAAGMTRSNPWKGVDCSNLSAFLLNFAFGFYPTSSIGMQACHPTYAPGRLLSNVNSTNQAAFAPGDLLYITVGRTGRTAPVRVSHVVTWTGLTANMAVGATGPLSKAALLANVSSSMRTSVESCMTKRDKAKLPVYVIADSSNNGPSFRPFCGWYQTSFSHARRVVDPSPSLPVNADNIAYWNETAGDCMSYWALQA